MLSCSHSTGECPYNPSAWSFLREIGSAFFQFHETHIPYSTLLCAALLKFLSSWVANDAVKYMRPRSRLHAIETNGPFPRLYSVVVGVAGWPSLSRRAPNPVAWPKRSLSFIKMLETHASATKLEIEECCEALVSEVPSFAIHFRNAELGERCILPREIRVASAIFRERRLYPSYSSRWSPHPPFLIPMWKVRCSPFMTAKRGDAHFMASTSTLPSGGSKFAVHPFNELAQNVTPDQHQDQQSSTITYSRRRGFRPQLELKVSILLSTQNSHIHDDVAV